jgi:hypothetical protein
MGNNPDSRSEAKADLNAKLAGLPSAYWPRVTELVTKAGPLKLEVDRVLPYAVLLTIVERQAKTEAPSDGHTRRSWRELLGLIHGFEGGYDDEKEAERQYRRGRRARSLLRASLDGVMGRWKKFQELVAKHRPDLPVHDQQRLSREALDGVRKSLDRIRMDLFLEDDVVTKERQVRRLSTAANAYSLWRSAVPAYRGKWSDMHRLAVKWRLSNSRDVEAFRGIVMRASRPGRHVPAGIADAWESLFEKS